MNLVMNSSLTTQQPFGTRESYPKEPESRQRAFKCCSLFLSLSLSLTSLST